MFFLCSGSVSSGKDQEDDDGDSEVEDLAEADEDESDLDLAWKMLDIARAIVEKQADDTIEKVDILSALAEVALERGLFFFGWISFYCLWRSLPFFLFSLFDSIIIFVVDFYESLLSILNVIMSWLCSM